MPIEQSVKRQVLSKAYASLISTDPDAKTPSPWFGELLAAFRAEMVAAGASSMNYERGEVYRLAVDMRLPFRSSGDWSESYRTIYHQPTPSDIKLATRLSSTKLATILGTPVNQESMFQ